MRVGSAVGDSSLPCCSASMLSARHHAYATAAVELPLSVVRFLLPGLCVPEMPAVIKSKYPWYVPFSAALVRLAEAHARGVPFDGEAAEVLRSECLSEITRAADDLAQFPEFARLHRQLASPRVGETEELKNALAIHAATHGVPLGQTETGALSTSQQAAKISGADKLPAWNSVEKLKTRKNAFRMVAQYKQAAKIDGKLHSQVSFVAATGRSTSSEPTLQNVPRDPRFRALIKARPGHLILSADYAAIELRIAAVLAERAVSDLRRHVKTFLHPKIQQLAISEQSFEPRFPMELGKAGEFTGKTYFGGGFRGPSFRSLTTVRNAHIYLVECAYCGKRFPRKRYSTRLRPHKDSYGNRCYGRSGYIAY